MALTIAGSDSGGGAGIQADLKTFSAYGVFGTSALTAITAQNTLGIRAVDIVEPSLVAAQIDAVLEDIGADAVKTGMLGDTATVEVVVDRLRAHGVQSLVVDPVLLSTSGHALLKPAANLSLKRLLFPMTRVLTPNLPEAEALTGKSIGTIDEMKEAARALLGMGPQIAVIKGGHLTPNGDEPVHEAVEVVPPLRSDPTPDSNTAPLRRSTYDVVYDGESYTVLKTPFYNTTSTHGTGCTFAAAICAGIALGLSPLSAIVEAKRFIDQAIRCAAPLGRGHGPLHHLGRLTPNTERNMSSAR